jgi:hypothetical protein
MSKLGYFIGGVLAGAIGTAVAAYAADALSTSSCGGKQEIDDAAAEAEIRNDFAEETSLDEEIQPSTA